MAETAIWTGESGTEYEYEVYPMDFIRRSSQPAKLVVDSDMSRGLGAVGRSPVGGSPFGLAAALATPKGLVDLFNEAPGTYIFAKMEYGEWKPIYIGEASNLYDRLRSHNEMSCVKLHGATHIHIHIHDHSSLGEALGTSPPRKNEERDLLGNHETPCNEKYP
ncbi:MAG: hypothetical protein ACR2QC_06870 [Gammaproteobacteria bacterium]